MTTSPSPCHGFRFPAEVIEHAVRLHHCFSLSLRDVKNDFRRTWPGKRGEGVLSDDGDHAHPDEGRLMTVRKVPATTGQPSGVAAFTPEQVAAARGYADAPRAASTRAKYLQHWTAFVAWCLEHGHCPLPADPAAVVVHLSGLAGDGIAPHTLALRMAAIGYAHRQAGEAMPHKVRSGTVILNVLAWVRREWGKLLDRKATADGDIIWAMLHEIKGDALRDVRDRALLSFGMVSCMRRSEIAALDVSDITRAPEGLRVTIRRSKSDQEGAGATIAIPAGRRLKPVHHLDAWLERAAIAKGPLFRRLLQCGKRVLADRMSDRSVAEIVKVRARAAGLDPALFAGHSLRAGFLTSAARAGASVWKMQEQSRHKSLNVLSGYVRSARLFEDYAGKDFA